MHHEQIQEFERYLGNIGIPYNVINYYKNYHYGYKKDSEGKIDFLLRLSSEEYKKLYQNEIDIFNEKINKTRIIIDMIDVGLYETATRVLAGIGAFVTMLVIKKIGDVAFKQESLGGGDIKLMFMVGLVIGYPMSVCNIFFATFIAFPIALFLLVTKKDNIIPFGPFLSMSAIILYVWGLTFTDIINYILT